MKTPKKIVLSLEKVADRYTLTNEENGKIMFFDDTDDNRQRLITAFIDEFYYVLNTEVQDGNKYLKDE